MICEDGEGKLHDIPKGEFTRPVLDCIESEFFRSGGATGRDFKVSWKVIDFMSGKMETEVCFDPATKQKSDAMEKSNEILDSQSKSFSAYWNERLPSCLENDEK